MGLASDVGSLVVLGVGVKIVGDTFNKQGKRVRKSFGKKGWHGESERHRMARYGIKKKK